MKVADDFGYWADVTQHSLLALEIQHLCRVSPDTEARLATSQLKQFGTVQQVTNIDLAYGSGISLHQASIPSIC